MEESVRCLRPQNLLGLSGLLVSGQSDTEWAQKVNRRAAADANRCIWRYVILDSPVEKPAVATTMLRDERCKTSIDLGDLQKK